MIKAKFRIWGRGLSWKMVVNLGSAIKRMIVDDGGGRFEYGNGSGYGYADETGNESGGACGQGSGFDYWDDGIGYGDGSGHGDIAKTGFGAGVGVGYKTESEDGFGAGFVYGSGSEDGSGRGFEFE